MPTDDRSPLRIGIPLLTAACLFAVLQQPGKAQKPDRSDPRMDACSAQLASIAKAVAAFEKDLGKLPDFLSDLHPRYVPDERLFHCPADPSPEGSPGRSFVRPDPKMRCSYSYEFNAHPSGGLPGPLGPFPRSDLGEGWGTWRHVMTAQTRFYGGQVPVVRCFHHQEEHSDAPRVINLSRGGRVYRSTGAWEDHPDTVAEALERATTALATPKAEAFRTGWYTGPLEDYLYEKPFAPAYAALRPKFAAFADALVAAAPHLDEKGPRRSALRLAALCYGGAGRTDAALARMDESMALGLKAEDYRPGNDRWGAFGSERDLYSLALIHRAAGRHGSEAALLLALNAARGRGSGTYLGELADAHEAAGNKQTAEKWRDQADPGRLLVSRQAPDFSLPTPDGGTVSLKSALGGKKALLVNFWFYGCGPCRAEAPHLQKLYSELKDKGLEIVAINLGDTNENAKRFVAEYGLGFKVAMGGEAEDGKRSVFSDYGVSAYPTNFLIDHEGKVVWHVKGFEESSMETLRRELRKLGVAE